MIIKFSVSNFGSLAETNDISFELGKKPRASNYDINLDAPEALRLNKVIAIAGANGAGKTQVIRALAFIGHFITDSTSNRPDAGILFQSHILFEDTPTIFEIDFICDDTIYRYKLICTTEEVRYEALFEKTSRVFSYLFVREKSDDGYDYKQKSHFGFPPRIAKKARKNVSLLAFAHLNDVPFATHLVEYFANFAHNVNIIGRYHFDASMLFESADFYFENPNIAEVVSHLLCEWDFGLSAITHTEEKHFSEDGEETFIMPHGVHHTDKTEFTLPFFLESSGTQAAYVLLRRLLPLLESGGVAIIDELDNDLHPLMLPAVLDLFKSKATNPHDAQLIFSCHAVEVLNELAKHQVYLVEKTNQVSETWRLDEMEGLRADDNLYAKYLSGALGGVPNL